MNALNLHLCNNSILVLKDHYVQEEYSIYLFYGLKENDLSSRDKRTLRPQQSFAVVSSHNFLL